MQQRRVRLGDILDDYCPRERRITNHVVVAMIEDQVKQTRCSTCDADHEYKQAKVPAARRKKLEPSLVAPAEAGSFTPAPEAETDSSVVADDEAPLEMSEEAPPEETPVEMAEADAEAEPDSEVPDEPEDEWGHRPLIRATLPRPEGQVPERKAPDFTIRQNGGRFDQRSGNNNRHRGQRQGQGHASGQPRFGHSRSGSGSGSGHGQPGQGQRQGNRHGNQGGGQRGGGQPAGHGGRGQGRGPKRGR